MKFKMVMLIFLLNVNVFSQEMLVVTEKQEFNFSTIIKTKNLKKVKPIENSVLNIKGTPYSEIKVTLADYYEVADDVYLADIFLLTTKDLFLDKHGELDVEITGNLYVLEKAKSRRVKERFKSPIRVEYK
ncbi:MAG: hypothetical protein ACRC6U_03155 [Fusobacteriaceae bacterium]